MYKQLKEKLNVSDNRYNKSFSKKHNVKDNNKLEIEKLYQILLEYQNNNFKNKLIYLIIIVTFIVISFYVVTLKTLYESDILEDNKYVALKNGLKYIDICLKDILNKEIPKIPVNNTPLISVIIPIYNANTTIKSAVRSIQNQNMENYEIILINDFSKDNSLDIILGLQKEDSRIKVMNNIKNMGTLYSRSVASLSAKGEYIFALDNDDMFLIDDLFEKIYKTATQEGFDIVGFKSVHANSYYSKINKIKDDGFHDHQHNLIVHQPELGVFTISRNNKFNYNDLYVWGKAIKTEIYKKAVNSLGKEKYSQFVTWAEDSIITFIIYNIAKSYKFVRKYGIFHLRIDSCASFTQGSDIKTFGEILFIDVLYDFSKNNSDKNFAALQAVEVSTTSYFTVQNNKNNTDYLKKVINKILESNYISKKNKYLVQKAYSKIQYYN